MKLLAIIVSVVVVVVVVSADKSANKRATPPYNPAYPAAPAPYSKSTYDYPAQPYTFGYDVNDAPSYNNFGHQEAADGKVTSGSYRVELPDGRTQVVTYKDEGYGLIATVKTEGAIKAYDYKPAYKPAAYPAAYPAPPTY